MKAVIPAAGLGTRFLPYTRSQPKEMLPIVDKPAIQYVVEEAIESGSREILIVTARSKRAIEDHFDRNVELERRPSSKRNATLRGVDQLLRKARIFYVRQMEALGLGHAVLITEKFVSRESFSVLLGDDLTIGPPGCQKVLLETHARTGQSVIAVQRIERKLMGRYGMIVGRQVEPGLFRVRRIIEKPKPGQVSSNLATLGRYVFTPGIFDHLREAEPDRNGEVQLTDAIQRLLEDEDVYARLYQGRRYDVGDKLGWLRANVELGLERPDLGPEVRRMVADAIGLR